jgi:hypothetical protein
MKRLQYSTISTVEEVADGSRGVLDGVRPSRSQTDHSTCRQAGNGQTSVDNAELTSQPAGRLRPALMTHPNTIREAWTCGDYYHEHYVAASRRPQLNGLLPARKAGLPDDLADRLVIEAAELAAQYGPNLTLDDLLSPPVD